MLPGTLRPRVACDSHGIRKGAGHGVFRNAYFELAFFLPFAYKKAYGRRCVGSEGRGLQFSRCQMTFARFVMGYPAGFSRRAQPPFLETSRPLSIQAESKRKPLAVTEKIKPLPTFTRLHQLRAVSRAIGNRSDGPFSRLSPIARREQLLWRSDQIRLTPTKANRR